MLSAPSIILRPASARLDFFPVVVPNASLRLLAIAGDIIHNLRCSLDHLAYHLVLASGVPDNEVSPKVGFPISASAQIYEAAKIRNVQGMRKEAVEAIDQLKPYKGGNEPLWKLHKLDCTEKHHLLVTVGYEYLLQGIGFDGGYWLNADAPSFKGIFAPDMQKNAQLGIPKTLVETEITHGDALIPTLHQFVVFVDNLIGNFRPLLE